MNDLDKAGRYLAKRDSLGFLRWLVFNLSLVFHAWIDARRLALPNQRDLTNDLVAALETPSGFEALCIELQAEARADTLPRMLAYLARVWTEPGDERSLPLAAVGAAILNLTGRNPTDTLLIRSSVAQSCRLELQVFANLAGCASQWKQGLRRWNVKTSPFLDEIRAEGREEAQVDAVRAVLLRMGRKKFKKPPTAKQQQELAAINDLDRLESLAERLLSVNTWARLINGD